MAGDWIKLEHATTHKPEVLKMARMLGISRREMVGTLVDFLFWCDVNCVDGVVDGVVDADVDEMTSCSGFSAVMKEVGWLTFESHPPLMRMKNWERHNGETTKKRALKNDRQARWRLAKDEIASTPASTKASTREEKRREDIHTHTTRRSNSKPVETTLPENFAISERVRAWAAAKGHARLEEHFEAFVCKARSKGYLYVDWDDAFMEAIRKDWAELNGSGRGSRPRSREPTLTEKRAATMDGLTGRARNERTIEGTAERVGGASVPALPGDIWEQRGEDVGRR
jgi:hypothetical protein